MTRNSIPNLVQVKLALPSGVLLGQVLTGNDSTDPAGMQNGLDVYCGYDAGAPGYRNGGYSNMAAIKARFPGKRYLSVGYDAIDFEPGLAQSSSEVLNFYRTWTPHNTNKPVFYADGSQMPEVEGFLSGAGIARSSYYLWLAAPNGNPSIPSGMDGVQWAFDGSFDADSFGSYMFGPPGPPPSNFPLTQGSTDTADVMTMQTNLNNWSVQIKLATPLTVDGSFGPLTAAAVTLAQQYFGVHGQPAGSCSQALFNDLKGTPGNTPPPPPPPGKWTFGPVRHLTVTPGTTTAVVSWASPSGFIGNPGTSKPGVTYYPLVLSKGTSLGTWLPGYPVYVFKAITPSQTHTLGGLAPGTYTVGVRAATGTAAGDPSHSPAFSTVTFTVPAGNNPPPPPPSGYKNPLRAITGLTPERIDQGVDYAGSGPLYSVGNGVVLNTSNSGWPGGTFISVRLSDGPAQGKIFYFAENITVNVSVGDTVTPDTVLGTLIDAYPNCELGWAAEPGSGETMARASGNLPADHANTAYGKNFSDFLVSLGAPPGSLSGPVVGQVEAGWPTWTAVTPPPQPPAPPPSGNFPLMQGSTDTADVMTLQTNLNLWLGSGLTVDGNYGPLTAAAVSAAQDKFNQHRPPAVNGECDQGLFNKLATKPPVQPQGQYPGPSQAVAAPFATINGEIIYGYLRQHGYSPIQAAGATASMWGEGEWSPEVAGTGGWGLMGWTGNYPDSRTGNPVADMQTQLPLILQFVAQFGDQGVVNQMASATTVLDSANLWGVGVERFGINDVHPEGIAAVQAIAFKLDGVNLP